MLAYVFWHWRQPTIEQQEYETDLLAFHRTLQTNKPDGFIRSAVFSINAAPWLATDRLAYEEWYLLDDSSAMDRINHAAVNGPCEEPHNRVARHAAGGTGGLYRLRAGQEIHATAKFATWFQKPAGMSYKEFDVQMSPVVKDNGAALWARTMTLGPTTEFCLHSSAPITLPVEMPPTSMQLNTTWLGQK